MFSGLSRRRDNVKVIRLGAVSNITLAGDDPDFIVIEVFDTAFSGSIVNLPRTAPIGKVFKFAIITDILPITSIGLQYVDIIVPLRKGVGASSTWRMYSGQRPIFTYGPNGWIADGGHILSTVGVANSTDIAIGSHAIAGLTGVAIGYNTNAYGYGIAIGHTARGDDSGTSVGYLSLGQTYGSAVGRQTDGNNHGAAIGYIANGSGYGAAVGEGANGSSMGASVGRSSNGSSYGAAVGSGALGGTYGVAVGYYSIGTSYGVGVGFEASGGANGVAIGETARSNSMDAAVALGKRSKAERFREMVKGADTVNIMQQSWSMVNWWRVTTDAVAVEAFLGGTANKWCVLLNNSALSFVIQGTAGVTGAGKTAGWLITGTIKRGADAASTKMVIAPVITDLGSDDQNIKLLAEADTTNGALRIMITGLASTTIKWNITGTLSELRF